MIATRRRRSRAGSPSAEAGCGFPQLGFCHGGTGPGARYGENDPVAGEVGSGAASLGISVSPKKDGE